MNEINMKICTASRLWIYERICNKISKLVPPCVRDVQKLDYTHPINLIIIAIFHKSIPDANVRPGGLWRGLIGNSSNVEKKTFRKKRIKMK
jgi:hypothetical protein